MTEESATFGGEVSITEAIIETICNLQGIEREEFDYVLYDWVDPDALAKLVSPTYGRQRSVTVEFTISEFQVTVRSDSTQGARTVTVERTVPTVTPAGPGREGARKI